MAENNNWNITILIITIIIITFLLFYLMSEECFGGVPASAEVSVCRLCPFCGDEGQDKTMFVCRAEDLNQHLSSIPLTTIRKMKYGKNGQKYEYHYCRCGCSFRVNVKYMADGLACHVNKFPIPEDHFDVEENPLNRDKDKEVASVIDALVDEHRFSKNYGPQRITSELRRRNIPDVKIPGYKQLENRLYYYQKRKFGYHNEALEVGLHW
jgi:hypothetical protein